MTDIIQPLDTAIAPPARFTYPFCYEPHPLCLLAAERVQSLIAASPWRPEADRGKMFGVLVSIRDGQLCYTAAYSGLLAGRNDLPGFVPPVFDAQRPDGYFKEQEAEISEINTLVELMENSPVRRRLTAELNKAKALALAEEEHYKELMAQAKSARDARRAAGMTTEEEEAALNESRFMKAELRRMKQRHRELTAGMEAALKESDDGIKDLKDMRKAMSDALQAWLFSQFVLLNARGESLDMAEIFRRHATHEPPAGSGECCAPKLLQHAYANGLHPVCMAEFWWGESPKTELRRHLHFYPACRGKCKPILEHMLQGLDIDPDPLADSGGAEPEVIYEDGHIAVVCKPAGMLSVPGKTGGSSVLSFMRQRCPGATGPMIVHRLDMATSGLLAVAKTMEAYRCLQRQFAERSVCKRYAAVVEGVLTGSGRISLPMRPDPLDRPRQTVDPEGGREAVTEWRAVASKDGRTLLELHPETGRTHQLRVHCAHRDGLNAPIVGDSLYGRGGGRLLLHAERLVFTHPATGRRMVFEREADFKHL